MSLQELFKTKKTFLWRGGSGVLLAAMILLVNTSLFGAIEYAKENAQAISSEHGGVEQGEVSREAGKTVWPATLDKAAYDQKLLSLVHYKEPAPTIVETTNPDGTVSTSTKIISDLRYADDTNVTVADKRWPPSAVYPHGDALLPFNRILAFYGNFYSTRMGILGEFSREEVLVKLLAEKKNWEAADPKTPVIPAIEYIAMVAQADAGTDGMYRAAMPDEHMERAYDMAKEINGIMIFDLQVGLSTLQKELPAYEKYLKRPEVHLAIDPEFAMKYGNAPGTVIGTVDASEINWVINYLSKIVRDNELPPKVLIVHRFTQNMVTNASAIKPTPEVQVVMVMDGWGPKDLKRGTYSQIIIPEPVQFTGIKIFYKNDLKPPSLGLLSPSEVLNLNPKPIFVQYQ